MVLLLSSFNDSYCGKPEMALQKIEELEALADFEERHKFFYYLAKSVAHTFNRDYELGAKWGRDCIEDTPTFTNGYKPLLSCLGHLGRQAEADTYLQELLRLDPAFSIERMQVLYPFKRDSDREAYIEGLRLAGVSD